MNQKVEKFRDIESGEIVTIEQLRDEWENAIESGAIDYMDFSWYIHNSTTLAGGTLVLLQND